MDRWPGWQRPRHHSGRRQRTIARALGWPSCRPRSLGRSSGVAWTLAAPMASWTMARSHRLERPLEKAVAVDFSTQTLARIYRWRIHPHPCSNCYAN